VLAFGYLGAFLDPDGNARNLPLALVDEDRGAEFGAKTFDLGSQVVDQVRAPNPSLGRSVRWTVLPSRRAALDAIRNDRFYAALIVPPEFSSQIVQLAAGTSTPRPATVEVLTNPASGSYAGTFSQTVATAAVDQISRVTSRQIADTLQAAGAHPAPAAVPTLGRPVEAIVTVAHPLGTNGGRGIAPFYLAVVLTLSGIIVATVANTGINLVSGGERLELLGRTVTIPTVSASGYRVWAAKLAATLVTSIVAAVLVVVMTVGILGMPTGSAVGLAAFAALAVITSATITLALLIAFGIMGELLAVFFTTIFGVPSAGGVYPVQALPPFFRFLHAWLPLRYVTDGARALVYFDGADLGLGRAILVLTLYTAGATLLGWLAARQALNRSRLDPRPPLEPAVALVDSSIVNS
jgi:YhgE/Pip-like protein